MVSKTTLESEGFLPGFWVTGLPLVSYVFLEKECFS